MHTAQLSPYLSIYKTQVSISFESDDTSVMVVSYYGLSTSDVKNATFRALKSLRAGIADRQDIDSIVRRSLNRQAQVAMSAYINGSEDPFNCLADNLEQGSEGVEVNVYETSRHTNWATNLPAISVSRYYDDNLLEEPKIFAIGLGEDLIADYAEYERDADRLVSQIELWSVKLVDGDWHYLTQYEY